MLNKDIDIALLFQKVSQENDYKAFEVIFHHFYSPLCNFAIKIVGKPEVAEELVADAFFKIWKNRQNIHLTHTFSSYLYTSVKNHCLDYLKKQNLIFKEISTVPSFSQEENPEKLLIQQELIEKIEKAIETLPDQCKTIFRLSRDRELKYQEIADLLHVSVKTVETQMGRALKYLRSALKNELFVLMGYILNLL